MTETKEKVISAESFKQIKKIQKELHKQIQLNHQNDVDSDLATDFSEIESDDLIQRIEDNDDLMIAMNLSVYVGDFETLIYNTGDDRDSAFDIESFTEIIDALVKLGRHGIAEKVDYNNRLFDEMQTIESKMDNVNQL